jgi:hypothetical protein
MAAAAITITAEVRQLREENAALRAQIAWLKRRLFGPGKGENPRPRATAPANR